MARENVIVDIPLKGGWNIIAVVENGELVVRVSHESNIIVKQARYSKYSNELEYMFTTEELEKDKFYESH
jgi:hypothetical protein